MTFEDIELLDSSELRRIVEDNIARDPLSIALDKRIPHATLVATQVKYLQRAKIKLPSYYHVRAILPPLAFEQSSSELSAARKHWKGGICIDLTCGLGVDAFYLAQNFDRVIAVERSPEIAQIARINFRRLGAENIEVKVSSAEEYMKIFTASRRQADLIYADPDRRNDSGRKQVRLEECSPNIIELLPELRSSSRNIAIKLSPLFDVDETFRVFGRDSATKAVSLKGECKEVLVETGKDIHGPTVGAVVIGVAEVHYPFIQESGAQRSTFSPPYGYMVIPDVSLRKARITEKYAEERIPGSFTTAGGYIFTDTRPSEKLLGRVFEVMRMNKYKPAELKRDLRTRGISVAEIYTGGFPLSAQQIAAQTGLRQGGDTKLAFTKINAQLWVIEVKEITLQE